MAGKPHSDGRCPDDCPYLSTEDDSGFNWWWVCRHVRGGTVMINMRQEREGKCPLAEEKTRGR